MFETFFKKSIEATEIENKKDAPSCGKSNDF